MALQLDPNVTSTARPDGFAQALNHIQAPYQAEGASGPRELATTYLREAAGLFGIDAEIVEDGDRESVPEPDDDVPRLHLIEENSLLDATTVGFAQWLYGLQIWEAGVSVTMQDAPLQVINALNMYRRGVRVGWVEPDTALAPGTLDRAALAELFGVRTASKIGLQLNSEGRWWLYAYDPALRHHPESLAAERRSGREQGPPTLELPEVDARIERGLHYPVVETLFRLTLPLWGELNWRAFIEPVTGSVLYVRAFVACATGRVYLSDPTVQTGNLSMRANAATTVDLDNERTSVTLAGTVAPAGGQQALHGEFVRVQHTDPPTVQPPTEASPFAFDYSSPTDNFAAVATYHHCDAAFRLVQDLGFTVTTYFNNTTFPVPVDHRGWTAINASCPGNAAGNGVGKMLFGPCDVGTTVGMGSEGRTVLHEFGHALLWDSVDGPNFGFAHSAGDALAMIVTDPDTSITGADRYIVFTFCPLTTHRRADRDVSAGWGWDGTNDLGGYRSEEILTTTLFRLYRSLGGDSVRQDMQEFASRYASYLIIRSIGSLATSPVTPTPQPDNYADALMAADRLTSSFEGFSGGSMHKVIRWSFEKQGLYQLPGAATPVTTVGAPPAVDVYIDDGRNGEYQHRENFWDTTDIWNRRMADGSTSHQEPIVGTPNFVYVRLKNRGRNAATGITVRGFHSRPMTGLIWPADWQAMTTAQINVPAPLASGGSTVVGPFEWTPDTVGHDCLLMIASATGDRSVVDAVGGTVTGSIPHWRLVPFDNNIAQRNVAPIAGGGRVSIEEALTLKLFELHNPYEEKALVEVEVALPRIMRKRGWRVALEGIEGERFMLGPGERIEVRPRVDVGDEITPEDLRAGGRVARIDVTVLMDGAVVGGMTFPIDPDWTPDGAESEEPETQPKTRSRRKRPARSPQST